MEHLQLCWRACAAPRKGAQDSSLFWRLIPVSSRSCSDCCSTHAASATKPPKTSSQTCRAEVPRARPAAEQSNSAMLVLLASAAAEPSPSTLLTQSPMLMAHDAATCYASFETGTIGGTGCYQWKTQAFRSGAPFMGRAGHMPSGFTSLLDCGARALDLRLKRGGPAAQARTLAKWVCRDSNSPSVVYSHPRL